MVTETDGIILKSFKIADDRLMLVILTRKFGKISAGTGRRTTGKNKSSLALRVFTHGRYEIFEGRTSFSINSAETIESFFPIAEDIDKYMLTSYAFELTEKMIGEGYRNEAVLDLLLRMLRSMVKRKRNPETLLEVYKWKLLALCGYAPNLDLCARCGARREPAAFSIPDGGIICEKCKNASQDNMRLLYDLKFDIIQTLKYIISNEFDSFDKLALSPEISAFLDEIFRNYISFHLDINEIKSENYLNIQKGGTHNGNQS